MRTWDGLARKGATVAYSRGQVYLMETVWMGDDTSRYAKEQRVFWCVGCNLQPDPNQSWFGETYDEAIEHIKQHGTAAEPGALSSLIRDKNEESAKNGGEGGD